MSSFLNFSMTGNQFAKAKGYDNVYQMDQAENPQDWVPTEESFVGKLYNEVKSAAKNWWYKNTGRAHLTDEYQYEQHLADTAVQRYAADMEAAGLSKFGGVGSASSPSPESGNGLLATALARQQLKTAKLDYDVGKYNFGKAKQWGVSTDAAGEFAKYDGIAKLLTGKSISELMNNEGGLFGWIKDAFSNIPDDSPFGFLSNVFGGAKTDELQTSLQSLPVDMVADEFAYPGKSDSYRLGAWFGDRLAAMTDNFTKMIKGNALKDLRDAFRNSLMQRGLSLIVACETVNSVLQQYMGHYKNIENYYYITKYGGDLPGSSDGSPVGSGYAGGGGYVW